MKLEEFKEMLEQHDWYYIYSDDLKVYRAGAEAAKRMRKAAQEFDYTDVMTDYMRKKGLIE